MQSARGGLSAHNLRRITDYVEEHLSEELGLVQLAELVGLTPWHFCRAFKRSTGLPPHRFLIQARVERAKRLLSADRSISVTEVALEAGFGGSTQLARAFRTTVGLSPREYRAKLS